MSSTLGTPLCPTFCVLLSLPISIQKHLSVLECDVNRAIQSMCSLITCFPHQVKFLHILAHKNEFYCVIKVSHINKIFEKYFKGKTVQFHFLFSLRGREREKQWRAEGEESPRSHFLLHSPNACDSQDWGLGEARSMQLHPPLSQGWQEPKHLSHQYSFLDTTVAGKFSIQIQILSLNVLIQDMRILIGALICKPNANS